MRNLNELYQQLIIDHSQQPHNFRAIDNANYTQNGHNPLCGDKITLYIKEQDGIISNIGFQGVGCAISTASASLMSDMVKNKSKEEVMALFDLFQQMVTTGNIEDAERLGKLVVLSGVTEFPMRVKCATLPWHTLRAALLKDKKTVTTE
jgi:nitrogen fixation NifU-like protein